MRTRSAAIVAASLASAPTVVGIVATAEPAEAGYCSPPPGKSGTHIYAEVYCAGGARSRGYIQARQGSGDWKNLAEGADRNPMKLGTSCLSGTWQYRTLVVAYSGDRLVFKGASDQYAPRTWTC